MNARGARLLITDVAQEKIWAEQTSVPYPMLTGIKEIDDRAWDAFEAETAPIAYQAMRETLEPVVRRTPRERYEAMLNRVLPDMLKAYRENGQMPEWPRSLQAVLEHVAARDHDPTLIERGGVEQVIRQGKALVSYLVETGARQQAAQDYKKVALDYPGH